MISWTGFVIAHRKRILAVWVVLFVLGGYGAANLGGLLTNRFSVPGSESERGLDLLKRTSTSARDGAFTLVVHERRHAAATGCRRWQRPRSARPAPCRGGKAGPVLPAGTGRRLRADLDAAREPGRVEAHARRCARAIGQVPGVTDVPDRLPGHQPRHAAALQRGPRARRVDRGPDRAARAGVHVRHARRRSPCRSRSRLITIPTTLGLRLDRRPHRWTWRST